MDASTDDNGTETERESSQVRRQSCDDSMLATKNKKQKLESGSSTSSPTSEICSDTSKRKHRTSKTQCGVNVVDETFNIDDRLEEIAEKSSLTATNVKSILKNVLENEHVIEMVKNIVSNNETEFGFEPKLTRSQLKQKQQPEDADFTLFAVEDDDDDDQEYKPVEEEEEEEDEDELDDESEDADINLLNKSESDVNNSEPPLNSEESNLICLRTRSKCHIEQVPTDTLELPDVTKDLYGDSKYVDEDWRKFLDSLFEDDPSKMLEDDENNDPEYNVLEDIEDIIELDSWDLRNDKAVKVSNKEFEELISSEETECLDVKELVKVDSSVSKWSTLLTEEDLRLLHQQMTQHVQLLTQSYLLTMENKTLFSVAESSKMLLNEVKQFSGGKEHSLFRTINLDEALKIVQQNPLKPTAKLNHSTSWRPRPLSDECKSIIVAHPNVFRYPSLLPLHGYFDISQTSEAKKKTVFTAAEDGLIALGLEQFKPLEKKCYKYIRQLLVPIKNELQIRIHVKNLKRSKKVSDDENPIKHYLRTGHVLPTKRVIEAITPRTKHPDDVDLPEWLVKELRKDNSLIHHDYCLKRCDNQRHSLFPPNIQPKLRTTNLSPYKHVTSIIKKYKMYKSPVNKTTKQRPDLESVTKCLTLDATASDVKTDCEIEGEKEKDEVMKSVTDLVDENMEKTEGVATVEENDTKVDDEDNESDLEALMVASSTITSSKMRSSQSVQNKREGKKSLAAKHKESTSLILSENWLENDRKKCERDDVLVEHFLARVREVLSSEDYVQFLTYLSEFELKRSSSSPTSSSIKELYENIAGLLLKVDAHDVLDEFVLFLEPKEAAQCGKTFDFLYWRRFIAFVRKLEVYFAGDSSGLFRLYKALWQLRQNESSIDKKKLRSTISKVVNNQPYLMHELSSLFLDEKPSDHLFSNDEDFDEVQVTSDEECDSSQLQKEYTENVNLLLTAEDLKYGTNECPCKMCHSHDSEATKKRHCIACSVKFIGGKLYLQSQKKPQLAEIHYNASSEFKRIEPKTETSEKDKQLSKSDNDRKPHETPWNIADDKLLLELCKSKIAEANNHNLDQEVFEEIGARLNRDSKETFKRFQHLLDIFKRDSV